MSPFQSTIHELSSYEGSVLTVKPGSTVGTVTWQTTGLHDTKTFAVTCVLVWSPSRHRQLAGLVRHVHNQYGSWTRWSVRKCFNRSQFTSCWALLSLRVSSSNAQHITSDFMLWCQASVLLGNSGAAMSLNPTPPSLTDVNPSTTVAGVQSNE